MGQNKSGCGGVLHPTKLDRCLVIRSPDGKIKPQSHATRATPCNSKRRRQLTTIRMVPLRHSLLRELPSEKRSTLIFSDDPVTVRRSSCRDRAEVAQLVEHSPEKAGVDSSILSLGTTFPLLTPFEISST